ncbi:MAG TPA: histidine kinase dimerization/phospho-acceptor domain-containing protein, partial [Bacillota bacterium]|nr:histidine kinase dimerization/phospho-acceptor domain-containing protein [Bacillota bacterium]
MKLLQQQLAKTEAMVRALQEELAETNRGLVALTLDLEERMDEREAGQRDASLALKCSNANLASTEATVRALQEELAETNRGLVALTLELEQRVDARTAELRQLNLELEARVQERTAQLRQANDNLQNFAHSAAHDLRSPLRAIKNFSILVLEEHGAQLDAEGQFLLQRVTQAAGQMQQLLNDLLEYSKMGEAALQLEPVSLQAAVREALALLEADLRATKAILTVEGPLPAIIGHPATVVLAINNFVSNALKFIPPGVQPQIRIWAQEVRSGAASAKTMEHRECGVGPEKSAVRECHSAPEPAPAVFVRLWVQDNGIG